MLVLHPRNRGKEHPWLRRHDEAAARGRRALRPPDAPLEPEDEADSSSASATASTSSTSQQTLERIETAYGFVRDLVGRRRHDPVRRHQEAGPGADPEQAERAGMPYVNHRWLGGMLTNFQTMRKRVAKIARARAACATRASSRRCPRRKRLKINRELRQARAQPRRHPQPRAAPDAVFVIDTKKEAHRGHRGQPARHPGRRRRRHQLRPGRHRLRRSPATTTPSAPANLMCRVDRRRRRGGPLHRLAQEGRQRSGRAPVAAERTAEEEAEHRRASRPRPADRPPGRQEREARIAAAEAEAAGRRTALVAGEDVPPRRPHAGAPENSSPTPRRRRRPRRRRDRAPLRPRPPAPSRTPAPEES